MNTEISNRLSEISQVYVDYLGRPPEPDALNWAMLSGVSLEQLIDNIRVSDEFVALEARLSRLANRLREEPGRLKVLLFGAYGNGNLGDREMAATIARYIQSKDGQIACFSYSQLDSADYPFCEKNKLRHDDTPLNFRVLKLFDALVVGGGGLLSYHHDPLWTPSWAQFVPIPVLILGCGVASPLDPRLNTLVEKAFYCSGRDDASVSALSVKNSAAQLCYDPILSLSAYNPDKIPETRKNRIPKRLFVLRSPWNDWHSRVRGDISSDDCVAVFEAHADLDIINRFENVQCVGSSNNFRSLLKRYDVVITERYHGTIWALLEGKEVHGVHSAKHFDKFFELFKLLDISEQLYSVEDAPVKLGKRGAVVSSSAIINIRNIAQLQAASFIETLSKAGFDESGENKSNAPKVSGLADVLRAEQARVLELEKSSNRLIDENTNLYQRVADLDSIIRNLRLENSDLSLQANEKTFELDVVKNLISQLSSSLASVRDQIVAIKSDNESLQVQNSNITLTMQAFRGVIDHISSFHGELISFGDTERSQMEIYIKKLLSDVIGMNGYAAELERLFDSSSQKNAELENEIRVAYQKRDELHLRVIAQQGDLDRLQHSNEQLMSFIHHISLELALNNLLVKRYMPTLASNPEISSDIWGQIEYYLSAERAALLIFGSKLQ